MPQSSHSQNAHNRKVRCCSPPSLLHLKHVMNVARWMPDDIVHDAAQTTRSPQSNELLALEMCTFALQLQICSKYPHSCCRWDRLQLEEPKTHFMFLQCSGDGADKLANLDPGNFVALLTKQALLAHGRERTLLSILTKVKAVRDRDCTRTVAWEIAHVLLNKAQLSEEMRTMDQHIVSKGRFVKRNSNPFLRFEDVCGEVVASSPSTVTASQVRECKITAEVVICGRPTSARCGTPCAVAQAALLPRSMLHLCVLRCMLGTHIFDARTPH